MFSKHFQIIFHCRQHVNILDFVIELVRFLNLEPNSGKISMDLQKVYKSDGKKVYYLQQSVNCLIDLKTFYLRMLF